MIINVYKYRTAIAAAFVIGVLSSILYFMWPNNNSKNQQPEIKDSVLYGEYLGWDDVNDLFPKYCDARVIDLETGWCFMIQRRGGTYHADVQPLTTEDTAVMKTIYQDKWSWKRRAVIVELDSGRKIAASMNGMPHGLGNIGDNNFDGHFCIHFKDSKTHGSRKVDTAHQLMIWKSADIVDQHINSLEAIDTIDVFLAAVDQGEIIIAGKLLDTGSSNTLLLLNLASITDIKSYKISPIDDNTFQVEVRLIYNNSATSYNKNLLIKTIQSNSKWKIDSQTLTSLLEESATAAGEMEHTVFEEDLEADSL